MPTFRGVIVNALRGAFGPAVIDVMQWLISRRDWAGAQRMGRALGDFGYKVHRRHRRVARLNLQLAYGDELSEERVQEIVRGAFRHVMCLAVETARVASMSPEEVREVCTLEGQEHLDAALAQDKGVVLFSGHLGNWEVGAVGMLRAGYEVRMFTRPPPSPRVARKFEQVRAGSNIPMIPYAEGLRGFLRALQRNCIVPILPDRFARGQGVTVPFFGRPTHVWHTPALLAARMGCPVVPSQAIRQADGTFVATFGPPIPMQSTGDREADLIANTTRCMALLEGQVRATPEQYAWFYELWRMPPGPDGTSAPHPYKRRRSP